VRCEKSGSGVAAPRGERRQVITVPLQQQLEVVADRRAIAALDRCLAQLLGESPARCRAVQLLEYTVTAAGVRRYVDKPDLLPSLRRLAVLSHFFGQALLAR
jgi:hypothetical protein